jgi:predicted secreted protein
MEDFRKIFILGAVTLVFGSLFFINSCSGSQSTKSEYETYKTGVMILSAGQPALVSSNDILGIELKYLASAGYNWYFTISDTAIIALDSEKTFELPQEKPEKVVKVGEKIIGVWKFRALKPGNAKITFKYYRKWEGEEKIENPAEDIKEFQISIQAQPK